VIKAIGCDFYQQDAVSIAKQLIGKILIRETEQAIFYNRIVETEAYFGEEDTACHASKGRTRRTQVMYQNGGVAYVYLIYGMYHMLNIVTGPCEHPQAVLIRAIEPLAKDLESGLLVSVAKLKKQPKNKLKTNGPGKLCAYLHIDRQLNELDITKGKLLYLAEVKTHKQIILSGPRIGIDYAHLKDRDKPWRFWLKDNVYVSK